MPEIPSSMPTIYAGWQTYQGLLTTALAPLTPEQLTLSVAPGLRTISSLTLHMIGARARWFYMDMHEGGAEFAALGEWDRPGQPTRTAAELIEGLEATWRGMQAAIIRWSPAEWAQTFPNDEAGKPPYSRHWIIWRSKSTRLNSSHITPSRMPSSA